MLINEKIFSTDILFKKVSNWLSKYLYLRFQYLDPQDKLPKQPPCKSLNYFSQTWKHNFILIKSTARPNKITKPISQLSVKVRTACACSLFNHKRLTNLVYLSVVFVEKVAFEAQVTIIKFKLLCKIIKVSVREVLRLLYGSPLVCWWC